MIKNIVFDLGNVLISFKPEDFLKKQIFPENIKSTILTDIFKSKEWIMLDNGDISTLEAIEAIAIKSILKKEEITHIFNLRTKLMFPLDINVNLLPGLRKRGFRLFYLSNFPHDIFEELRTEYSFFKYFDGGIISAEVKYSKPNSRIYEILIEKYFLNPKECLFIDDLEINVKAAEKLGMKGLATFGSVEIYQILEKALIDFF